MKRLIMRNNKIFNVVNVINKRYQGRIELNEAVLKDISDVIREIYGSDYVSDEYIKIIVALMSRYSN